MNIVAASQREALIALYEDLMVDLSLNEGKWKYFIELLVFRHMKNVDPGMKLMSGGLSKGEQQVLARGIKKTADLVTEEMKYFLNNPKDSAEWEFYEKTMSERMILSQVDAKLAASDATLSDDIYRNLLELILYEEKKNFNFSSNPHDKENPDMNPFRLSQQI